MPQDSSQADFWDSRYLSGVTPWDAGGVPPRLLRWLQGAPPAMRVLIPGCGTGYELAAFAERGHEVTGLELSDAAIAAARKHLGPLADRVVKGDFFAFPGTPFDLVYERAFLCALPRRLWPQWAARVAALTRPRGVLAGFFYLDDNERGPPFGILRERLEALLSPHFALEEDEPVPPAESLAVFKGREVWQVWRRRL